MPLYHEKIPQIIREAIEGLDHPIRWSIIVLLIENNEIEYDELKEKLKIHPWTLYHHLRFLYKGNLIDKRYVKDKEYYKLSEFGRKLLTNILSIIPRGDRGWRGRLRLFVL